MTVDAPRHGRSGPDTQELAAVVRDLAAIVADGRRARADDDDGPADAEVVFARDLEALATLQRRHALPLTYVEFLRHHSSHDFVASGLEYGGEAAWLTAVDTVAELTDCCPGASLQRPVCAVSERGHYLLDLARTRGGDCPVLHVDHDGEHREVAPGFLEFLRRVARDSRKDQVARDMPQRTASPRAAPERAGFDWHSWAIAAALIAAASLSAVVCGG